MDYYIIKFHLNFLSGTSKVKVKRAKSNCVGHEDRPSKCFWCLGLFCLNDDVIVVPPSPQERCPGPALGGLDAPQAREDRDHHSRSGVQGTVRPAVPTHIPTTAEPVV